MSHVEYWTTDSAGETKILEAGSRPGIEAHTVAKNFSRMVPNGGSVRSLQAAANPGRYNLREYPTLAKHSEEIRYEEEEVTMAEAKKDRNLSGRITSDDEYDFDDDDVVFIRHTWYIPADLSQSR